MFSKIPYLNLLVGQEIRQIAFKQLGTKDIRVNINDVAEMDGTTRLYV